MKLALNRRNLSSLVQAPMRCWSTNSASNFRGLKKKSFESKQHVRCLLLSSSLCEGRQEVGLSLRYVQRVCLEYVRKYSMYRVRSPE